LTKIQFRKSIFLIFSVLILFIFSTSVLAADEDLVAHYQFNGDLSDATTNFSDFKITGDRIFKSDGNIEFTDGKDGKAAVFNGKSGLMLDEALVDDYSYSIAFWVNADSINQFTTTFFGGLFKESEDFQTWISFTPEGPSGRTMLWSGTDWYDATSKLKIPTKQWVHLAATVNKGQIKFYINGNEHFVGNDFPDIFSDIDAQFALGVNYWDVPFDGKIDDLRIYDDAISGERVSNLAKGAARIEVPEETVVDLDPESVSVHDPMIIEENGTYYVFGSHLGAAKSDDLIEWEQMSNGFHSNNPIIAGNPADELSSAMQWPDPDAESTWAKSPIKVGDKYYLYFSASTWGATRSAIGLTGSDNIEGPYEYEGIVVKSFNSGQTNIEGAAHDPRQDPNAIDPHVFFDKNNKMWMLYGSYAGGIYILEMDPNTMLPLDSNTYGKKISGGDHAAMEGSYILYHPETDYYYYTVSYGTLAPDGGYNIRLARSKNPDGPFIDSAGQDIINADPRVGDSDEPYGARIIGNFLFQESEIGYLSPGHNSLYYDQELDKMFAVMHSRFPGMGNQHQVRVHQMIMNSDGWPLITPHRYTGEVQAAIYTDQDVTGNYQYINHGTGVRGDHVNESVNITLTAAGNIDGLDSASWEKFDGNKIRLNIAETTYSGALIEQYDEGLEKNVMTFTALSDTNLVIWGSKY